MTKMSAFVPLILAMMLAAFVSGSPTNSEVKGESRPLHCYSCGNDTNMACEEYSRWMDEVEFTSGERIQCREPHERFCYKRVRVSRSIAASKEEKAKVRQKSRRGCMSGVANRKGDLITGGCIETVDSTDDGARYLTCFCNEDYCNGSDQSLQFRFVHLVCIVFLATLQNFR